MDISVVIVTWNGRDFTRECLESLARQQGGLETEIIVVDNASSDGTPELIRERFPNVRLIENAKNEGFAKANNTGIRLGTGKYVCLINSDVNVPPACLSKMHAYMEGNPDIGVLGPRMIGRSGQVARSYMRFPSVWNYLCHSLALDASFKRWRMFGGSMMTDFDNQRTQEVDVLNGWLLMVRRGALDEVGLLDERFFMYGEDIDWSYRFHKAGWKRVYFAGAEALHYGAGSSASAPIRFYLEMQRANLQLWRKHFGRVRSFAYLATVWVHAFLRLLGHGARYCLRRSQRPDAAFKVERSLACISWLSGLGPIGRRAR
jgi:hypothetical protein